MRSHPETRIHKTPNVDARTAVAFAASWHKGGKTGPLRLADAAKLVICIAPAHAGAISGTVWRLPHGQAALL